MFVLDQTSRPQPNELLEGVRALADGQRMADERTYRRMMENRALTQADQRTRNQEVYNNALLELNRQRRDDAVRQNEELLKFYREQASPERAQLLAYLQEEAEKRRLDTQLEYDKKFRDAQYSENPLSRYGVSYGDLVNAETEDEGNQIAYDAAGKAAKRAEGLFAELNKGGDYQVKLRRFEAELKKATDPGQKEVIQSKIDNLQSLSSAYNESLQALNRSGFKVINDGGKFTVAAPPSRMAAFRKLIPNFDSIYPGRQGASPSLGQRPIPAALGSAPPVGNLIESREFAPAEIDSEIGSPFTTNSIFDGAPAFSQPSVPAASVPRLQNPATQVQPTTQYPPALSEPAEFSRPSAFDEDAYDPVKGSEALRSSYFDLARSRMSDPNLSVGEKKFGLRSYNEAAGRALGYTPIEKGSSLFWKTSGDQFANDPYGESQLNALPSDTRDAMFIDLMNQLRSERERKSRPSTFMGIPVGR